MYLSERPPPSLEDFFTSEKRAYFIFLFNPFISFMCLLVPGVVLLNVLIGGKCALFVLCFVLSEMFVVD
jgi:hypothetical protein